MFKTENEKLLIGLLIFGCLWGGRVMGEKFEQDRFENRIKKHEIITIEEHNTIVNKKERKIDELLFRHKANEIEYHSLIQENRRLIEDRKNSVGIIGNEKVDTVIIKYK